jgi:hypothetical protein
MHELMEKSDRKQQMHYSLSMLMIQLTIVMAMQGTKLQCVYKSNEQGKNMFITFHKLK